MLLHQTDADCCGSTIVQFGTRDLNCSDFGARKIRRGRRCSIYLCGDGKPITDGTYCGKGPCNLFGCNCDGGCIEGDASENFKAIHGHNNVYFDE